MTDLDAAIRARLDLDEPPADSRDLLDDWDAMARAILAVLDLHKQYDQYGKPVCGHCVYVQGGDNVAWPCDTLRVIAEKLGVGTDLVAFIEARLAEDEQLARDASFKSAGWQFAEQRPQPWGQDELPAQILASGKPIMTFAIEYGAPLAVDHVLRWDPARVLAEITAKRKRLALYLEAKETLTAVLAGTNPRALDETPATAHSYSRERIKVNQASGRFIAYEISVKLDAMAYADHEDFDERWRT